MTEPEKTFLKAFALELMTFRKKNNLTQEEAALHFNVPAQTLRNWEYQRYIPNAYIYVTITTEIRNEK